MKFEEIEKVALGLNYPCVAFKGINDYYVNGVEFEEANDNSALFAQIKQKIANDDERCKRGYRNYGMLIAIIFKEKPNDLLTQKLQDATFEIYNLPKNPYIAL